MRARVSCRATVGVLAVASIAVAPSVAGAAPQTAVRHAGLQVSWPGAQKDASVVPGGTFVVRVRPVAGAKRSAVAQVRVTREAGPAGPAKAVLRRSVRSGKIVLRAARQLDTRYAVVVRVGKRTWPTTVTVRRRGGPGTPPNVGPTPVPPAPPVLPPWPREVCAPAGYLVAPGTATAGAPLQFSIVNTGPSTLVYGARVGWDRLDGSGWTMVPEPPGLAYPDWAAFVGTGTVRTGFGQAWDSLTPGTYRITLDATCREGGSDVMPARDIVLRSGPVQVAAGQPDDGPARP